MTRSPLVVGRDASPAAGGRQRGGRLARWVVRVQMRRMALPGTRTIALLTAFAGALALAIALASQHFMGLAPCELCLMERWPYRVVIVLGVLAFVLPSGWARALLWLAVLVVLADTALAVIHVGVEQHAWPSPMPECAAPTFHGGSIADMLKSMPARPSKPCDAPSYLIPGLPLSMAALNLLFSLAFAALLATGLWSSRRMRA
jgi:disulfide bond formation protein DsbB